MSLVQTYGGAAKELSLSWCRKKWFNISDTKHLLEGVVRSSAKCYAQLRCIGRALWNSEWCPGYFMCNETGIRSPFYLASLDQCVSCDDFELLIGSQVEAFHGDSYFWQPWQGVKHTPENALIAGTHQGQPVYVARTKIDDVDYVIGGFVPNLQMANFNHQMRLLQRNRDFDLLVMGSRVSG